MRLYDNELRQEVDYPCYKVGQISLYMWRRAKVMFSKAQADRLSWETFLERF